MSSQGRENFYDVVIIGGGPAGLTAALYLARACYRVVVVEKEKFGGQITITSEVVNYPGVGHTSGTDLTETMRKQAESFGAEFILAEVERLDFSADIKRVMTSRGVLECFGVLLASGAHPRTIGFKGEEEFKGRGVAYCATCDGEFFTGKEVFVIGGGFAAAEESVFLTKYASHVTVLIREDDFTCAKSVADKAKENKNITVITNVEVDEVAGGSLIQSIRYHNTKTKDTVEYKAKDGATFGVFVFAGYEPATELVKGIAQLNEQGYVITDRNQKTSVDGLYAAGDVCVKNLRQVVTAVGDGALAATELERYASSLQSKTGITPKAKAAKQLETERQTKDSGEKDKNSLFSDDMLAQLHTVFDRMEKPLRLKLYLDKRPVSSELQEYMQALAKLTEKLTVEMAEDIPQLEKPCVKICYEDGTETGLAFHGVPGGHEFTSFVLGIYNASGPGQPLEGSIKQEIEQIKVPVRMQIMVSLTCTMCPELVTAAQRIASENPLVSAEVYDINHFGDLKDQYKVMSVPCMVINGDKVLFGKKNIKQLLEIIS
jgi:thioredoxin reductase (NADPH)